MMYKCMWRNVTEYSWFAEWSHHSCYIRYGAVTRENKQWLPLKYKIHDNFYKKKVR